MKAHKSGPLVQATSDTFSFTHPSRTLSFTHPKKVIRVLPENSPSIDFRRSSSSFLSLHLQIGRSLMAPQLPLFYSGTSTLALVARVSAFTAGAFYGSTKLKYLKMKGKSQKKAEAKDAANAHH